MTCPPDCKCRGALPCEAVAHELQIPVAFQLFGLVVAIVGVCGAVLAIF